MPIKFNPRIINDRIHAGADGFSLPLPILDWQETPGVRNETAEVYNVDGALLLCQRILPRKFSISGEIQGWPSKPYSASQALTPDGAAAIKSELERAVRGPFSLFRYTTLRWDNCVVESLQFGHQRPDNWISYRMEIACLNPTPVAVTDDGSAGGSFSDYGNDIHGVAQLIAGTEYPISEGEVIVPSTSFKSAFVIPVLFPGLATATESGEETALVLPPTPTTGGHWRITRVSIIGATGALPTGTTTLKVGTAGIGGSASVLTLTLDASARRATSTSGFLVDSGATLYCWLATGGVHSDLQVMIQVEST